MVDDAAKNGIIRQRVLYSTVTNYISKIVTLGTSVLLTPFILHHLGATGYGLWILVGSVVAYGSLLDFGVASAVTKYLAEFRAKEQTEQAQSLVATALCLYCVFGLAAVVLSALIAPLFPMLFPVPVEQHAAAMWLVVVSGLGVGLSIPCGITSAVLRGLYRFDIANMLGILGTMVSAGATVVVLLLGGGVLSIAVVGIGTMLLMQLPSVWVIRRVAPELRLGWRGVNRELMRTIASFSSSLFVLDIGGRLQVKTDEIVIGAFLAIQSVTPYAICKRLSEVAQILTDQFMKVLLPLASELHAQNDQRRLRALYITSTRLTLAIFLPIACVLVIFSQPILTLWVGEEYAGYGHVVTILTIASLIVTSQWPAGSVLQGMARHRPLAIMSLCSGVANFVLSILLVRMLGVVGVALGTLIPTAIECLGFVLPYALKVVGVSMTEAFKEIFLPALLPALPTALVLYLCRQMIEPSTLFALPLVAGVGVLVYVIGYISIGANTTERQVLRSYARSTMLFAAARFKR